MSQNCKISKIPELLCPAGDYERLRAAINFGADAVYMAGQSFGMRTSSKNFDEAQIKNAIEYAHSRGVKVYITCNILMSNDDIEQLPEFAKFLSSVGADAVIVSDIGALNVIKKHAPALKIHISVQTGVYNYEAAKAYWELGAKRIVLSRELSLEQITLIREKAPKDLELEAFVHGSICVSFSGRCLLSDYMVGRSANRGDCAQPCRWKYALTEEKRPNEFFPIIEDESGTHIMNSKDLCMINYIPEMINAGITSFKIEGRAKSSYYTAVTANAYRCAIDEYLKNPIDFKPEGWMVDELFKVSHRDYSTGFYLGKPQAQQCYEDAGYIREHIVIGVVEDFKDNMLIIKLLNKFLKGDTIEISQPGKQPVVFEVTEMYDKDDILIETARHAEMIVKIPFSIKIALGAYVRKAL